MRPEDIRRVLIALEGCAHSLNRDQVKQLYQILIACGHYPICPWCNKPIYNINDFSWDHITPRALGGKDTLDNLQPMHKHCNNEDKQATAYQTEYNYDIKSNLTNTVYSIRITISKNVQTQTNKKDTTAINTAKKQRKIKNNIKHR